MPGGVIEVERRRGFGPLEWLHVPSFVRAVCIPSRHGLRNLVRRLRGHPVSSFTQALAQTPELLPAESLGMPVLVARSDGTPRCVACGLCEIACPAGCIELESDGAAEPTPSRFRLDTARCLFCGLCEEACPDEAIVLSPVVARASTDRRALVHELGALLVPADRLESSLARVRALDRTLRPDPPALRVLPGEADS